MPQIVFVCFIVLLCTSATLNAPPDYIQKHVPLNNARFQIKVDQRNLELTRISGENFYQGQMPDGTKIEAVLITDLNPSEYKPNGVNTSTPKNEENDSTFDSWSIVWYIASFGGLIAFFLIVSCSEWCCRKHVREQQAQEAAVASASTPTTPVSEVPPPAYELFAPPPYDTCFIDKNNEKREFDVYVVPVHAIRPINNNDSEGRESPPAYAAINVRTIAAQSHTLT